VQLILFLHGLGGRAENWASQVESLSGSYPAIALDLRGFGRSDPPSDAMSLGDYADDVVRRIETYDVDRLALVGLSFGGMVAQELALRRADLVDRLVLADTYADLPEESKAFNEHLSTVALGQGMSAVADMMVPGCFTQESVVAGAPFVEEFDRSVKSTDPVAFVAALEAINAMDLLPRVKAIEAPTLVLMGEYEPLRAECERLREAVSGSELGIIEGAGHVSNLERPHAFTEAIRKFLG
jgi:3-oxoadipate enol-lactonase